MQIPEDIARAYSQAPSQYANLLPAGRYKVRATSIEETRAQSGSSGLAIELVVLAGKFSGQKTALQLWLTGRAFPRARAFLEGLGFGQRDLAEIVTFDDFESLPAADADVAHEVSGGNVRQVVTILPGFVGGDDEGTAG